MSDEEELEEDVESPDTVVISKGSSFSRLLISAQVEAEFLRKIQELMEPSSPDKQPQPMYDHSNLFLLRSNASASVEL